MTRPEDKSRRLGRRFYRKDAVALAKALLGMTLVRITETGIRLSGRIVETEAYLGVPDLAAHTAGGRRTARNEAMYADAGYAYIYFTYGMHHCMNVVADRPQTPTAVLIRALEPTDGLEQMRVHRARKRSSTKLRTVDLCSGPAKLCEALGIDRTLNGCDMTRSDILFIEQAGRGQTGPINMSRRIGVDYAGEWARRLLRFYLADCAHVSRRLKDDQPLCD